MALIRTVYIYGLWDCRDSRLRYIGKTVSPTARLRRHKTDYDRGKITHCSTWIKGLLNDGLEPMMEILEECTENNWKEAEKDWIAKARGFGLDLVNMVDGGMGGHARGVLRSDETKQKIRLKLLGRPGSMKGMKHTEESKLKNKLGHLGKRPRLGMKNKPETNAKIGAANAKALRGKKLSEEQKERLRQLAIDRWQREGERDRQREKISERTRNDRGQFVSN